MKLNWDLHELVDFGQRVGSQKDLDVYLGRATQEIAKKLHKMLITETPVDWGDLRAGWKTPENYKYIIIRNKDGYEVLLVNRVYYARWVNDGHKQQPGRFIPGFYAGGKFRYNPNADGGIVLKRSWDKGRCFVVSSVLKVENSQAIARIIEKELRKRLRR